VFYASSSVFYATFSAVAHNGTVTWHPTVISLTDLFEYGKVAVLTGAGMSTDSGIPDYRGEGSPRRTPMNIEQFRHDEQYRRRFWAGARIGALRASRVEPNEGHRILARLEQAELTTGVITQNVDDLHHRGGTERLTELHGNGSIIRCVHCGTRRTRTEVLEQFDELNPGYVEKNKDAEIAPDGDAIVRDVNSVVVPECTVCGGILRADVVYFGETVAPDVFQNAVAQTQDAHALLCLGTSLAVNTGIRLVHRVERRGLPIAVVNRGPTAIDRRADLRIEGGSTETLQALAQKLSLSVPELQSSIGNTA
jgi:NAD-dependent SIR2 family protein deacetylase